MNECALGQNYDDTSSYLYVDLIQLDLLSYHNQSGVGVRNRSE